jgi:hypothetical protein
MKPSLNQGEGRIAAGWSRTGQNKSPGSDRFAELPDDQHHTPPLGNSRGWSLASFGVGFGGT